MCGGCPGCVACELFAVPITEYNMITFGQFQQSTSLESVLQCLHNIPYIACTRGMLGYALLEHLLSNH